MNWNVPSGAATITTLGVPTRGRPRALERCLRSYAENARAAGRNLRFVVADDSGDARAVDATRHVLSRISASYNVQTAVISDDSIGRYVDALCEDGSCDRSVADFALRNPEGFDITIGAARNRLLLATLDELSIQADDDTICRPAVMADHARHGGLTFFEKRDAAEFWFFNDQPALLAGVSRVTADYLGEYETLLGKGFDQLPQRTDDATSSPYRVAAATAGFYGDMGSNEPLSRIFAKGDTFERLVSDRDHYKSLLVTRHIVRSFPGAHVSPGGPFYAGNLGLDNRGPLPPFAPVQRSEDAVFGGLLRRCYPDAIAGYLPIMFHHDPIDARAAFDEAQAWKAPFLEGSGHLVSLLITTFVGIEPWMNWQQRLGALGRYLEDIGRLPTSVFHAVLHTNRAHYYQCILGEIHSRRTISASAPAWWKTHLDRMEQWVAKRQAASEVHEPPDLARPDSIGFGTQRLQCFLRRFGALLQGWPNLVVRARALAALGISPLERPLASA